MARASPPHAPAPVWAWTGAGALTGLLSCLLLFAPARWLALAVSELSAGHLELTDPQGTVWNGSAELVLTGGPDSRDAMRLAERVQWRLQPGWGDVKLRIQAPCCTPNPVHLRLSPGWQGLELSVAPSQSHWPAKLLSGLGAPWNTIQLDGRLSLSTPSLSLALSRQQLSLQGELTLEAHDLHSRLTTLRPMGSYRLSLQGGAAPSLRLETLSGSLRLSGAGHWSGRSFRFDGVATALPAHEAELANLLNIIGRREGARSIITLAV